MPAPLVISRRGGHSRFIVLRTRSGTWNERATFLSRVYSTGKTRRSLSRVRARGIFTAVALRPALSRSRVPECRRFLRFIIGPHANPSRIAILGIRTIPRIRSRAGARRFNRDFILLIDATRGVFCRLFVSRHLVSR